MNPRFIKQIDDTVKPKPYIPSPVDGDITTLSASVEESNLRLLVAVEDIGNPLDRHVFARLTKERFENGVWSTEASDVVELINDDSRLASDEPHSEPENYYYIYSYDYASGAVLSHDDSGIFRVKIPRTIILIIC